MSLCASTAIKMELGQGLEERGGKVFHPSLGGRAEETDCPHQRDKVMLVGALVI